MIAINLIKTRVIQLSTISYVNTIKYSKNVLIGRLSSPQKFIQVN